MAFVLGKGFVDIDVDDDKANRKFAGIGKRMKKFEAGLNKFVKRVAVIGGAAIAGIGAWAIKVAAEQERAESALKAALDKANEGTAENIAMLGEQAAAIQKVTTYGDEEILMHMANARNMGVETSQLDKATRAAIGLAKAYNVDVKTAMLLITRANKGQTQMLTRYGIVLDQTLSETGKFQQLLKIGESGFQLAMAETETLSGKLKQLKNVWGDAGEKLGIGLVGPMTDFAEAARNFIEQANFAAWGAGVADALKAAMEAITAWRRFVAEGEEAPGVSELMFVAPTAKERSAFTRFMTKRREGGWRGRGGEGILPPGVPDALERNLRFLQGAPESLRLGGPTEQEKGAAQAKRDVILKEQAELLKKQIQVQEEMLFGINDLKNLNLYQ